MADEIVLQLLRRPRFSSGDRELGGAAARPKALLFVACVALGGPDGVSRTRLKWLFWPASHVEAARTSLKQMLYLLRRETGQPDLFTSVVPATPLRALADARPAWWARGTAFGRHAMAIASADLVKLRRDPTEMFTRAVQPLLWLLVFGQVFAKTRAIPTGPLTYVEFMAARGAGPERAFRRDLLWHRRDLGARSRHRPQAGRCARVARITRRREGDRRRRPRLGPGRDRLPDRVDHRRPCPT